MPCRPVHLPGHTRADHDVANFGLNFAVLAISFVVEGFSCVVAVRALSEGAERRGVTFAEYLDSGSDPAAVAVMAEDGAAVIGVTIAAISNWLVIATDWQAWDGLGSILVGVLLSLVALFLIQRNRAVLIGRSMAADELAIVLAYLYADPVVNHVYDARSEEIGPGVYRFSAELDFDGEKIAERHLKTINPQQLAHKFFNTQNPAMRDDTRAFSIALREYGSQLVRAVGSEVDRIEGDIQNLVPGVRYVDLEADRGRFWLYRASVDGDEDIRDRFDISQLSLDAVAWQSEETKINYLLSLDDGDDAAPTGGVATSESSRGSGTAASGGQSSDRPGSEAGPGRAASAAAATELADGATKGAANSGRGDVPGGKEGGRGAEAGGGAAVEAGVASVVSWDEPPAAAAPAADSNGQSSVIAWDEPPAAAAPATASNGQSSVAARHGSPSAASPAAAGNGGGQDEVAAERSGAGDGSSVDAAQQGAAGRMTVIVGASTKTGQVVDVELGEGAAAEAPGAAAPLPAAAEGPAPAAQGGGGSKTYTGTEGEATAAVAEEIGAGTKGSRRQ